MYERDYEAMNEAVNHPTHYRATNNKYETIKVIDDMGSLSSNPNGKDYF